jgi:aminoglycoside 3-N-acetyltransferase
MRYLDCDIREAKKGSLMSDMRTIHTISSLSDEFAAAGLASGQTVIVHSSMSRIGGWVAGGAEAVILALLHVLGDTGTLMMPTHTSDNSDPAYWVNPPIPKAWWKIFREESPAYRPAFSRTWSMGILPETMRTHPDALRSSHPAGSFAAIGKHAADLTATHDLSSMFGDQSPLSALYDLDGAVFLLGVGHGNNTSLHLAEARATYSDKQFIAQGSAMLVNGERQWVTYEMIDWDDTDFIPVADAYDADHPGAIQRGNVGKAPTLWMKQRPLVDYATDWFSTHRPQSLQVDDAAADESSGDML